MPMLMTVANVQQSVPIAYPILKQTAAAPSAMLYAMPTQTAAPPPPAGWTMSQPLATYPPQGKDRDFP